MIENGLSETYMGDECATQAFNEAQQVLYDRQTTNTVSTDAVVSETPS